MKKLILLLVIIIPIHTIAQKVKSRGRAELNRINVIIDQTGTSDGYIINMDLVGNSLNVDGVLNAFDGTIDNIANLTVYNTFTQRINTTQGYDLNGNPLSISDLYNTGTNNQVFVSDGLNSGNWSSFLNLDSVEVNTLTYGPSWSGNFNVPTMDALYNVIEALPTPQIDYISDVSLSNDTMYFTNVGNAFGGVIVNIANLSTNNTFLGDIQAPGFYTSPLTGIYQLNDSLMFSDFYGTYSLNRLAELVESSTGDGYVSSLNWNISSLLLTTNDPVNGAKDITLSGLARTGYDNTFADGTYQYFGSDLYDRTRIRNNDITISGDSGNNPKINFAQGPGWHGWIEQRISDNLVIHGSYGLTLEQTSRQMTIESTGIFAQLDEAVGTSIMRYNSSTNEITWSTADVYGWSVGDGSSLSTVTNGHNVRFTATGTSINTTRSGPLSGTHYISFELVNDQGSPGNDKYYGTNSLGTKGYYDLPTGGGSGYWELYSNGIRPISSYEIYVGGAAEQGGYSAQFDGGLHNTGRISTDDIYIEDVLYLAERATAPLENTPEYSKLWFSTSGDFYKEDKTGTSVNLTSSLDISTSTINTYSVTGHTHKWSSTGASNGQVPIADGSGGISWGTISGGGSTDLSYSVGSSPVTLYSSSGDDVTITAGTNITLTSTSGNLIINSTAGSTIINQNSFYIPNGSTTNNNIGSLFTAYDYQIITVDIAFFNNTTGAYYGMVGVELAPAYNGGSYSNNHVIKYTTNPSGITVSGSMNGDQPQLRIQNASGIGIRVLYSFYFVRY